MTLRLPLCNDLFCPEPFFFRSTSGMMNTLLSAVSLGLARLNVQTTGEAGQLLHGELAMNCNPSALDSVASTSSISCPLTQAPVAYEVPKGCKGVQERLQTHCGLSPQAVALASDFLYSVDGQSTAGFAPGHFICLPEGCRPCDKEPIGMETSQMTSEGHFQVESDIAAAAMQVGRDDPPPWTVSACTAQTMILQSPRSMLRCKFLLVTIAAALYTHGDHAEFY